MKGRNRIDFLGSTTVERDRSPSVPEGGVPQDQYLLHQMLLTMSRGAPARTEEAQAIFRVRVLDVLRRYNDLPREVQDRLNSKYPLDMREIYKRLGMF
ncbi:MAG: hypothetical protein Q8P57_04315 [Candidatus Pacearchaeota archaeon]|nr:hypothetical protein [Candidatus Pacearchaeota archaeon]